MTVKKLLEPGKQPAVSPLSQRLKRKIADLLGLPKILPDSNGHFG